MKNFALFLMYLCDPSTESTLSGVEWAQSILIGYEYGLKKQSQFAGCENCRNPS